ncbi:MAG: helix-turn-helix domain-containing protein [Chloroflexi bacterium]|nr:MAG: helix-turn-helix domain-containing protein [Chloroflexota bacterium]
MTNPAIIELQKLVAEAGTQAAAASKLGTDPASLNRWLRGKRPVSKKVLVLLGCERVQIDRKVKQAATVAA